MKKMNKMYEAPRAEVVEMQNVAVLMGSGQGGSTAGDSGDPNVGGGGGTGSPFDE
jgi:hypothetical protein